ncbi:MAG: hypothetical protein ACNYZI_11190 [Anaerolineales bacterium]
MSETFFPVLILNARPAAGKSEILHALKSTPVEERIARFHIGPLHILDDFPMIWAWFEEDHLLETVFHQPRLHTDADGYFLTNHLWHLLIERLSLEYEKWRRDTPEGHTVVLEFSRGGEHGGYEAAYKHLSREILSLAACLYVDVTYEESLRKNRARFNPERPDSILEHGLPDEKLERLYRQDDWSSFSSGDPQYLSLQDIQVPYVNFENADNVTSNGGEALHQRLEERLATLWSLWQRRPAV